MTIRLTWFATTLALGSLLLTGCYGSQETEASIAAALEEEGGGYDELPELPGFGLESELEEDARLAGDMSIEDPTEAEAAVASMRNAPDTALFHVHLEWGQFPFDRTAAPYNWSGRFAVNRGAIVVRRVTRFELFDHLRPRTDPRSLDVISVTRPHHDGITITIIDPTPGAEEPLVLSYVRPGEGAAGATVVRVASLVEGPRVLRNDDAGNRMIAGARVELRDRCQHGMLAGRWHRLAPGRGRFLGRVVDARGDLVGHVRGIYGVRRNGDRVFFGKYINTEGRVMGLLRGTYGGGELQGRWIHRSTEVGAIGGRYVESIPGPETGGHFIARWAELSCDR